MKKVHVWMAAAAVTAVVGLVYAANSGAAGSNGGAEVVAKVTLARPTCLVVTAGESGDVKDVVAKIAAAIKKGDKAEARKLAETYAKKADSVEDAMDLFKKKDKDGIGFGSGPKETDGIEVKIREVARDGAKTYAKDAKLYEAMGYNAAAIGMIADVMTPKKDIGQKTVKGWKAAIADQQEAAFALAKAKSAGDVKTAATKLNNACIACHAEWRK